MKLYVVLVLEADSRVIAEDLFGLLEKAAAFRAASNSTATGIDRAQVLQGVLKQLRLDFESDMLDWEPVLACGPDIVDYIIHREALSNETSMDIALLAAENEESAIHAAFESWAKEDESITGNPHIHTDISPTRH